MYELHKDRPQVLQGPGGAPSNALIATLTGANGSPTVGVAGLLAVGCAMSGAAPSPRHYVCGGHGETPDGVLRLFGRTRLLVSLVIAPPTLERIGLYLVAPPSTPADHARSTHLRLTVEDYATGSVHLTWKSSSPAPGRILSCGAIVRLGLDWAFQPTREAGSLTPREFRESHNISR